MPLDPEMIIAVQLSRSCTSVRVFAFSRFSRFSRFRVLLPVFAFSRFRIVLPVFAFSRENAAHHQRPRHTHFLHSFSRGAQILLLQNSDFRAIFPFLLTGSKAGCIVGSSPFHCTVRSEAPHEASTPRRRNPPKPRQLIAV